MKNSVYGPDDLIECPWSADSILEVNWAESQRNKAIKPEIVSYMEMQALLLAYVFSALN